MEDSTDTRTHFGRLCFVDTRMWSGVCPGSSCNRSRLSDSDFGKPAFMSGDPRPAFSSLRELCSLALTLLGRARFIAWCLRRPFLGKCRRGSKYFFARQVCLSWDPAQNPTKTRPCATLVRSVGRTTNINSIDPFIEYNMIAFCVCLSTTKNTTLFSCLSEKLISSLLLIVIY